LTLGGVINYKGSMRAIVMLALSCALLVGCRHARPSDQTTSSGETKKRPDKKAAQSAKEASNQAPREEPISGVAGKIASVNSNLRFVVIDFTLSPLPRVEQQLGVFRQGQKVGEVKISSQARNNIVAADLTAGEAAIGDEVRPP
jgi:hypothetical protein